MSKNSVELNTTSHTPLIHINRESVSDLNALNKYTATFTDAERSLWNKSILRCC